MHMSKLLAVLGASLAIANPVRQRAAQRAELEGEEARSYLEVRGGANPTVPGPGALRVGWVAPGTQAFRDMSVYHHNVHRANHSAPAAVWNHTLYEWAQAKALTCLFNEDGLPGWDDVGMNIAGGTYGYPVVKPNPSDMISGLWYNSEVMNFPQYGVGNPNYDNFENWGHFSQLVWPSSTEIGCGIASCGNSWFGLCLYSPPGNWDGEFNFIGRPKGYPIVYPNGQTSM